MSVVAQDTVVSNDSTEKTYTFKEIITQCMSLCGGEVSGILRSNIITWINMVMGELYTDMKPHWVIASSGFDTLPTYTTGTATFTKGDKTVTFAGGAVILSAHVGRKLVRDGDNTGYVIDSLTNSAEVEIVHAFMGEDASAVGFTIVEDTYSLAPDFDDPKIIDQHFTNTHLQIVDDLSPEFKIDRSPRICKITLDKNLVLQPAPDRIMKITYDYFRAFSKLTDETAVTSLPDQHVSVLSFGVARNYWLAMGQGRQSNAKAQQFANMFEKGKIEIRMDKYNQDGRLVQFVPYRQPGIVNAGDADFDGMPPALLIGQ